MAPGDIKPKHQIRQDVPNDLSLCSWFFTQCRKRPTLTQSKNFQNHCKNIGAKSLQISREKLVYFGGSLKCPSHHYSLERAFDAHSTKTNVLNKLSRPSVMSVCTFSLKKREKYENCRMI